MDKSSTEKRSNHKIIVFSTNGDSNAQVAKLTLSNRYQSLVGSSQGEQVLQSKHEKGPWQIDNDMKILSWNVRGLNDSYKQDEIKKAINKLHPYLFALAETRVKLANVSIAKNLLPQYTLGNNYSSHYNGGLWMLWKLKLQCQLCL